MITCLPKARITHWSRSSYSQ